MTEIPGAPTATSQLDDQLRDQVASWMRLRWWLTVAVAVVLVVAAVVGGVLLSRQQILVSHQEHQLTASCALYHDLGQLPVRPTPPLKKVGQISVVIVLDARKAFIGQCGGHLDTAEPSLVYWARYYRLSVPAPLGRS